jgi:hypothetical protein
MLRDLFPRDYGRYLALPLLGPTLGDFEPWLLEREFCRRVPSLNLWKLALLREAHA